MPRGSVRGRNVHRVANTADGEIIEASVADSARFAEIWDRHKSEVHRYVARRLGAPLAEDVTADVFLTAFRLRGRFDVTRTSALPWLYGIAGNLIGKHRRGEVRALRALARTGVDPVAESWTDSADDRIDASGAGRALAGAMARLSPDDLHTLLLVAWSDLTYTEVAHALEVPVGTVRSRLHRARTRVRNALAAETGDRVEQLEESTWMR